MAFAVGCVFIHQQNKLKVFLTINLGFKIKGKWQPTELES